MTGSYNAVLVPVNSNLLFKGRPGDLRLGQWVKVHPEDSFVPNEISLFGCPDDKGVLLNLGRAGANLGPDEIRKAFYKMAYPMDGSWEKLVLRDAGNISPSTEITETHERAYKTASDLAETSDCIILLGGGHDFAAPGFGGTVAGFRKKLDGHRWGLINIDPHLDVRELIDGKPHSGSSFRQLLDSQTLKGQDLVQFGCRENRNSVSHYQYCKNNKVSLAPFERLKNQKESLAASFRKYLNTLGKRVSSLGITLDIDSCAEVMGSSAANTIGFSARELFEFSRLAGAHPKTRYFEIAEVAPSLDLSGKTAQVAAEILYAFLCGRSQLLTKKRTLISNKNSNKTVKNIKNKQK